MRIHQEVISIESSDPLHSENFGIRQQDMSFILDILRKKMYRDPIRAIMREVSCNARDAHREKGTPDLPVEINLPTKLNKQLEIKDFGPGINSKRMWDVFIHYGASTKRDSNVYCGGWGLGAKTPMAYSDSFSIVTVHGGKKRYYTAIIDESRNGKMELLSECNSSEPTGTTVILPIKEEDIQAFANAAVNETRYWSIKHNSGARPQINNLPSSISFPKDETPMLEGSNWELFELEKAYNTYYNNSAGNSSLIIIDGIGYNVTPGDLELDRDAHWARALLDKKLYMYFPIGKISLASNRDNIHFDDNTKKIILKRLEEVHDAVLDHAVKKINEFASLADAEDFWHKFTEYLPMYKSQNPKWKGFELKGNTRSSIDSDKIEITRYCYEKPRRYNHGNGNVFRSKKVGSITFGHDIYIFDQTSDHGLIAKIKNTVIRDGSKSLYVINFLDSDTKKRWMDELGLKYIDFKQTSSLPAAPRKARVTSDGTTVKRGPNRTDMDAWIIDPNYSASKDHERYMRPTKIEKKNNDGGIYIEVVNKTADELKSGDVIKFVKTAAKNAKQYFDLEEDIYAIKTKDIPNLGSGWQRFDEVFIPLVKDALSEYTVEEVEELDRAERHTVSKAFSYLDLGRVDKYISQTSPMHEYISTSKEIALEIKNQAKFKLVKNTYCYLVDAKEEDDNKPSMAIKDHPVVAMKKNILARYPLLKSLDNYSTDAGDKDLAEYINLIDNKPVEVDEEVSNVA